VAELERLHEAVVGEDEIDHLGHMNVRFYLQKAIAASRVLTERLGLSRDACAEQGRVLELRDAYTRHRAEQMAGARLEVHGGVLDVRADGVRLYLDLVNPDRPGAHGSASGEIAASFVHDLALRDRATRASRPLPENAADRAGAARVEWPQRCRPRSLYLYTTPAAPSLALVREHDLAMRLERVVREDECDADGVYLPARYQELFWAGEPSKPGESGRWLVELEGGGRVGWATLESRGLLHRLPRAGTRIQSFGAEVELARKTCRHNQWVYDVETGELLCTSSIVNLAFDIGARRAIEIPDRVRAGMTARRHPDLR